MNSIYNLLNPDNTVSFNRYLAHAIGLSETIIYCALIAKCHYYKERNMLDNGGWFYSTIPDLQESTALTEKQQKRCITRLIEKGLIKTAQKGMPAKRCFFIVDDITILSSLLDEGKLISSEIKVVAALKNSEKSAIRDKKKENPFNDLNSTCSDKMDEQVPSVEMNMLIPNSGVCSAETDDKSKIINLNNNNPNIIDRPDAPMSFYQKKEIVDFVKKQIDYPFICSISGENFADMAVEVISECITSDKPIKCNGVVYSPSELSELMKHTNYDIVAMVSDNIYLKKGKIRCLKAYLTTALIEQTSEYISLPSYEHEISSYTEMRKFKNDLQHYK